MHNKGGMMINPLVFIPGASALLFTVFEMPVNVKKVFFSIPVWISSSVLAIIIGTLGRGVLGPMTGFMTELILFPGLYFAKKHYRWSEGRLQRKTVKKNLKETKKRRKQ
jgi:hypothetical protein